jgi:hypothetical protein
MKPKDHANLLSIFAWIMAGWQMLFVLLFGLYVLITGGVAVGMALDPKVNDPGGPIVMAVMAAVFGVFTLFGLTGSITNFVLGRRLRAETPPTQKFVITACIINFVGFLTGGIFAAALGGYGLWFATSDQGKAFFAGQGDAYSPPGVLPGQGYSAYDPNYARDPSRINWR